MSIEINNESDSEIESERVLAMMVHHFKHLRLSPRAELSVMFINEKPMEDLHIKWMDEPGPTDVLSFPMDELRPGNVEAEGVLGDIVICPQVARLQADAAGHAETDEIMLLATHGLLHLLGFDHAEPEQEAEMFGLQRELLDSYQSEELS
jgi:probable rRNA maturation factor